MRLWRNNRIDGEYEMAETDIAAAYFDSEYATIPWPLDRKVRAFMTATDGLSSVWLDEGSYERVIDAILADERRWSR